ncbi:hypothetical protein [Tranquillimonas alkanivorans]|uniref:Uncharacterized protein n=1 Tax=Tranquillimonas alkanivorans TaxID=441119 RepID=A0A1I5TUT2_9RHOB|nr:hypothetical protein [Tranquillimonas alkanivorans]SFP86357.1 hypothetical protein SAMN04488047_11520 [Tranquillimonas alkanivorans]
MTKPARDEPDLRDMAFAVAREFSLGMRQSLSAHGVERIDDYMETMSLAGMLIERRLRRCDGYVGPSFLACALDRIEETSRDGTHLTVTREELAKLRGGVPAATADETEPTLRLRAVAEGALACDGVVADIARSTGLTAEEQMEACAHALAFTALALDIAKGESTRDAYVAVSLLVRKCVASWTDNLPEIPESG